MDWYSMSDPAIMIELGKRLREYRLRKNITQGELARKAGLSTLSVQNLEKGSPVSLSTLIPVLRMLNILGNMGELLPELPLSPVDLLKLKGKNRKRATSSAVKHKNHGKHS